MRRFVDSQSLARVLIQIWSELESQERASVDLVANFAWKFKPRTARRHHSETYTN